MNNIQEIEVQNLKMWYDNVRYEYELDNERECIEEIFERNPGLKKMKNLLDDVVSIGHFLETFIVHEDIINGHVILDGNRRFSLLKICEYNDLIEKYKLDRTKLGKLNKITSLTCNLYQDLNKAYDHVERRHLGQQDGVGVVQWDTIGKDRMRENRGEKISIGTQVYNYFKQTNNSEYQFVSNMINNPTTITRILRTKYIYKEIFNLKSCNEYNLSDIRHTNLMNSILKHFYENNPTGNVKFVYYSEDVKKLFSNYTSEQYFECREIDYIFDDPQNLEKNIENHPDKLLNEMTSSEKHDIFLKNQSSSNSYKKEELKIFEWRNEGIIINNNIFKYYLEKLIELKISSKTDDARSFIYKSAPIYYRIMLDIAIKEYTNFINETKNKRKFNSLSDKENNVFNTTSQITSFVNSNKLNFIFTTAVKIKCEDKKNVVKPLIREIKKSQVYRNGSLDHFINGLNDVIHGTNAHLSEEDIKLFDSITLMILKIISCIIK